MGEITHYSLPKILSFSQFIGSVATRKSRENTGLPLSKKLTVSKTKRKATKGRADAMYEICKLLGVHVREMNPNSFRLKKEGFITIDYYPKSNKVFFHDAKEWGETTDIIKLIKYQFT